MVVEEEGDSNPLSLLFTSVVLASLVSVSVSFPVPTTASLSVITSLEPVDDGEVVDKEEGAGGPM